jgi:DNA-binding MarR family transcriptional regulator
MSNKKNLSMVEHEVLVQAASDALHQMLWRLRLDQLGTWSKTLKGMAQLDLHILKLIAEHPDIILKEICQKLLIPNSTLTSAINRLEKKGLLKRIISYRDRRSYGLEITEKGWEIKKEHDEVDRMITLKALSALQGDAEAGELVDMLERICKAFE